jgi:hypothetical protein
MSDLPRSGPHQGTIQINRKTFPVEVNSRLIHNFLKQISGQAMEIPEGDSSSSHCLSLLAGYLIIDCVSHFSPNPLARQAST